MLNHWLTSFRGICLVISMLVSHSYCFANMASANTVEVQRTIDPSIDLNAYADEKLVKEVANDALRYRLDLIKRSNDRQIRQNEAFLVKAIAVDQFNVALLNRQLVYHPVILLTVLILVLTATVLVVVQFRRWNQSGGDESALEISKEGLKLRTPFVGLIMLVASYAFFYLYIERVYEIRPLADQTTK